MRIAFWLQHLLGIGHVRRGLLLCQAMQQAGLHPVVLYGGFPIPQLPFEGVEMRYLPPLKATDTSYSAHVDAAGQPITANWLDNRIRHTLLALDSARADALLTESFPFGRGVLKREVIALLEAAKAKGIPCFSSVRDILVVESRPGKHAKMARVANQHYDRIFVHGDEAVIPFSASFTAFDSLSVPVTHTGYIAPTRQIEPPANGAGTGEIVVSAGGGAFGTRLMQTARQVADQMADQRWRLLLGPNLPSQVQDQLQANLPTHVLVEPARPDFPALLPRCALSISQGGYNTTLDVLSARSRALLVPNEDDGQTEQIDRARLLHASGHIHLLPESALTPDSLAAAVSAALAAPPPSAPPPGMSGAQKSAEAIARALA